MIATVMNGDVEQSHERGYSEASQVVWSVLDRICRAGRPETQRVAIDEHKRTITFVRECYEIDVDTISTELDLIECIQRLCQKTWMEKELLSEFVGAVATFRWLDCVARNAA